MMMLTATVLLAVVTHLASADPTYSNNQDSDVIREVDENLVRKGSDSVLMQVLLTMSRLQYDMSSLAKSVRDLQNGMMEIKSDITEIKSSQSKSVAVVKGELAEIKSVQLTQQRKMAIHQNSTIQLQKDVADIKSTVNKPAVPRKKACPGDFTYTAAGGCYKTIHMSFRWHTAAAYCKAVHPDAHLIVVNSAKEQRDVENFLAGPPTGYWWTAGRRADPEHPAMFLWDTTDKHTASGGLSLFKYTNWEPGTPNSARGKDACVLFYDSKGGKWDDAPCTASAFFVCEVDM